MSDQKQLFSASLAKDAVYKTGLRSFMEYRDLGVERATHGAVTRPGCTATSATSRCFTC